MLSPAPGENDDGDVLRPSPVHKLFPHSSAVDVTDQPHSSGQQLCSRKAAFRKRAQVVLRLYDSAFYASAQSFSLPDSSPKIGKQQLPSRNWSFTRCPSAPTLGKDPAHARKASASGFLRKLLSYLGKSRPRQKQVGEHVAWEESAFNAGIVASRHSSSKWAWQVVESTEYYSKRDSSKGAKPVTADADGTEWRVGTYRDFIKKGKYGIQLWL
ncbi:hypothetical protein Salat_0863300 [Sesamum alatum]|uniref:Uncharacterized protein n=1 Tax=Sesamum alatum TaxID=300844 RepID=A0AAE2CQQ5_9LAMI|nr:hypothetical protein Salat_0863300 [Sesamum alatum]